jgi:hypothetical protein
MMTPACSGERMRLSAPSSAECQEALDTMQANAPWRSKHRPRMEITPSTIWQTPAYLPYVHPKLMPRAVLLAERELGVILPFDYLKLLENQNGGLVRFIYRDSPHSMLWGIGPELPSLLWHWGDEIVPHSHWLPKDVRRLIPFDGNAYSYLCLDYRDCASDEEPSVILLDLKSESERRIASTFAGFLALLVPEWNTNTTFGTTRDWAADAAASELSRLSGVAPIRQVTHGFERHSLRLGDGASISISSNLAPRAYDTPRYPELLAQFEGTTLRFPEHPQIATILSCTEPALGRMKELCREASMQIVGLR